MQYSLRQLMLSVTAVSIWSAIASYAFYYFGIQGLLVLGLLFGIALLTFVIGLAKWKSWSTGSRALCAFVLFLSLQGGLSFTHQYYTWWWEIREQTNLANRLQQTFQEDPRFASISVVYDGGRFGDLNTIRINGSVKDANSLDAFGELIDAEEKEYIHFSYQVNVRP